MPACLKQKLASLGSRGNMSSCRDRYMRRPVLTSGRGYQLVVMVVIPSKFP